MKTLLLTPPGLRMMNPQTFEPDLLPPKSWVPLGIAYLASALRANGFEAEIRDLHDADWEEVGRLLAESEADMVGISCFTFERGNAMRTASLARCALPNALVVMGGPHATFFPEQVLQGGCVDVVAFGEGEETVVDLAACRSQGRDLGGVAGIAYRDGPTLRMTPPRPRAASLDAFPFPDQGVYDLAQYVSPEVPLRFRDRPGTHVLTSRGCAYRCRFCSVPRFFAGGWAFRSPGNVADELEALRHGLGVRHVYFSDDLFSRDRDRTIALCREIIDRGLDLDWMAETRVDCVDKEMLRWMRRAGCHRVYYGVESGSPRILKSIRKGFTPAQVAQAFDLSHRAGIEPCCFLMVGNPGESPQTIAETVELVNAIRPATPPIIGIATILPGTELYELSKRQGLIVDAYWLTDGNPPLYTGEHGVDDLISLQLLLTRGVYPELYEHLRQTGFDEGYFRLRRLGRQAGAGRRRDWGEPSRAREA